MRRKQLARGTGGLAWLLALVWIASACGMAAGGAGEGDAAFVAEIGRRYPALRDARYEIDTVRRIVDGDTFETAGGVKIRLIGVNTPEITNGKSEAYGAEAKAYAVDRLEGRQVYLFRDAGDADRYGRKLRYVFVAGDAVMFNEALLADGYANTMTIPPNVLFAEAFAAVERSARERGSGLWAASAAAGDTGEGDTGDGEAAACPDPQIKGNINSRKEKIYHVPGSAQYDRTKAEQMFCTEEEAEKAGFRKAKT